MNNGFYQFSKGRQEATVTSSVFPYTGSAIITGSLGITGSLSQGQNVLASGSFSHAEGGGTQALGDYSHTEGRATIALGSYSHAEGTGTSAEGAHSHAEGSRTQAKGNSSHAEGQYTTSSGDYSHAEGYYTEASGPYQHVQGQFNISSSAQSAFIVGNGTADNARSNLVFASGSTFQVTGSVIATQGFTGSLFGTSSFANNAISASFTQTASFAPAYLPLAGGTVSGSLTVTNNLTVLGSASIQYISESTLNIGTNLITINTINPGARFGGLAIIDSGSSPQVSASFLYDSVQDEFIFVHRGTSTSAITSSHFVLGPETYNDLGNENYLTANRIPKGKGNEHLNDSNISDNGSVVSINSNSEITGSLSQGVGTAVIGQYSHAEGNSTIAEGDYSHAEGYTSKTGIQTAFQSTVSSGLITIDSVYGDVISYFTVGGYLLLYDTPFDNNYNKSTFIIDTVTWDGTNTLVQLIDTGVNTTTAYVGDLTYLQGNLIFGGDKTIPGDYSHTEGNSAIAVGNFSHAEGYNTQTIGESSHAEGSNTQATGYASHAEGINTQAIGESSHAEGFTTIASGSYSHAEGYLTQATGLCSHAEGENGTLAQGLASHAEGRGTTALGRSSHAEGSNTLAQGSYSHAEGESTQAIGYASHAEGFGTVASGLYQHVQGQYNISSSAQSAFIIGNGIDSDNRSNLIFAAGNTVQVTGSVIATQGFTGSLFGTATTASFAPFYLPIAVPQTTGLTITFTQDRVYGTFASPETGSAITSNTASAILGVTNLIIHSASTAPTLGSDFKKLTGSSNYVAGLNYIYCTYIANNQIIYSINQAT